MSGFLNDPEAQRRYEERFGKRDRENEVKGPTETPDVKFGTGETFAETIRRQRAEYLAAPVSDVVFTEPSARLSSLAARLRDRNTATTDGNSTSGGSF